MSSSSSHPSVSSLSSPPSSATSHIPEGVNLDIDGDDEGNENEDAGWGIMDALYWRTAKEPTSSNLDEMDTVSLSQALVTDLDGSAFGARSSISSTPMTSPELEQENMVIPNFPPLSMALLQEKGDDMPNEGKAIPRTSGMWWLASLSDTRNSIYMDVDIL